MSQVNRHKKNIICTAIVIFAVLEVLLSIQVYKNSKATREQRVAHPAMVPTHHSVPSSQTIAPVSREASPFAVRPARIAPIRLSSQSCPAAASRPIYTTSRATAHNIGGGDNAISTVNYSSSSSRGIRYTSVRASVPSLAMSSTSSMVVGSTYEEGQGGRGVSMRRIQANGDGSYDGETKTEGGYTYYWDEDTETWVLDMPVGTTKTEGGLTYVWNGTSWDVMTGTDPLSQQPIGDAALPLMLLACAYLIRRSVVSFQ